MASLILRRGDLAKTAAQALVTSANDSLVGNTQPMYWRFISRTNADGALRKAAGPELEAACLAIEPLDAASSSSLRRDITRWTSGVKHGTSKVVRCPAGSAVSTPAFGDLEAEHVIHAVTPDSEFGYEGMYTGGLLDQRISGAVAGNDTPTSFAGGAADGLASQQFTPPDDLLLATYESALSRARHLGVGSVALCALGTGVKGWKPAISCAVGLEAIARALHRHAHATAAAAASSSAAGSAPPPPVAAPPPRIEFVIGGVGKLADETWKRWVAVHRALLGSPPGLEQPADYAAEAQRGELRWELPPGGLLPAAADLPRRGEGDAAVALDGFRSGTLLPLELLPEFQEMWQWRRLGKNGKDEPLSAEQELRAVGRRSTR